MSSHRHKSHTCKNIGAQVSIVVPEFPTVLRRAPEVLFPPYPRTLLATILLSWSTFVCVVLTSRFDDFADHRARCPSYSFSLTEVGDLARVLFRPQLRNALLKHVHTGVPLTGRRTLLLSNTHAAKSFHTFSGHLQHPPQMCPDVLTPTQFFHVQEHLVPRCVSWHLPRIVKGTRATRHTSCVLCF